MTKEDWIEYFECREKYDRPMSDLEKDRIMEEAERLTDMGNDDAAVQIAKSIPMKPYLAFCLKCAGGLSALKKFNYSCLFCMKLLRLGVKMKGGVMIANYGLPVYYKQLRTHCLQIVLTR